MISRWLVLLGSLALVSCAPLLPKQDAAQLEALWAAHAQAVATLDRWSISARIAFRDDKEGWSASLLWDQEPNTYAMKILGPLGRQQLSLSGTDDYLTLQSKDGQIVQQGEPGALLRKHLGIAVPVVALRYWVLGLPRPGGKYEQTLTSQGYLKHLVQDGWSIDFSAYQSQKGLMLPGRLELQYPPYGLKMFITDWRVPGLEARARGAPSSWKWRRS